MVYVVVTAGCIVRVLELVGKVTASTWLFRKNIQFYATRGAPLILYKGLVLGPNLCACFTRLTSVLIDNCRA